jgi:hypothetical protein
MVILNQDKTKLIEVWKIFIVEPLDLKSQWSIQGIGRDGYNNLLGVYKDEEETRNALLFIADRVAQRVVMYRDERIAD